MSGVFKSLGKILPIVLGAAAVIFTAGAAIPAIGAIVGTGGLSGAIGSVLGSLGIEATSTLGTVLTGAASGAATGAALGGVEAAVTGKDIVSGMEGGMGTGALAGGVMSGFGALTGAGPTVAPDASGPAAPTTAASGAAGDTGLTGATVSTTPVTSGPLPGIAQTGAATNGSGGLLTQGPGITPVAASGASTGAAGAATPADLPGFQTPQAPSAVQPSFDVAPAGTPNAPPAPSSGGGLLSGLFGKDGMLGNGGLGYVVGGVGSALIQGQTAEDTLKGQQQTAQQARDAVTSNYGQNPGTGAYTPGGNMNAAGTPSGLQSPSQAFNPTSRWVYDATQKRLVLVPQATS